MLGPQEQARGIKEYVADLENRVRQYKAREWRELRFRWSIFLGGAAAGAVLTAGVFFSLRLFR